MNAKYSQTATAHYISDQLASGDDEKDLAISIASYLVDEGKTANLDSLLRDVTELRSRSGVIELTARSAFPLNADQKVSIQRVAKDQYPGSHKVIIHEQIDPKVIGGVSLSLANANLDLTIKTKLNRLREEIT